MSYLNNIKYSNEYRGYDRKKTITPLDLGFFRVSRDIKLSTSSPYGRSVKQIGLFLMEHSEAYQGLWLKSQAKKSYGVLPSSVREKSP
jgi:hypothetical protein